jgi:hypothetical protein
MNTFEEWYQYVLDFYGKGGIYDMGATKEQVVDATNALIKERGNKFEADFFDRERVRDIMIERYKLTFPK